MIRKVFVCPWFGPWPEWWGTYLLNLDVLHRNGYDIIIDTNLKRFKQRAYDRLGVVCPIEPGTGKVHDYRAVLPILYRDEIAGADFWGHTDFDCVYGNPANFAADELLETLDIWTDGWDYVNGPWTLYRNTPDMNTLYASFDGWQDILEEPETLGWVETSYTDHVRRIVGGRMVVTYLQTKNLNDFSSLRFDGDALYEGDREVLFAHFRRVKKYPAQLLAESGP